MLNTLVHPWMLLGLAAMAIPLIIEWLFRRRRQRIAFPAMRYLMNPRKRRRVRLQDLILLLVRTVVPGVLVIALARPLFRPDPAAATGPRNVVIVLDGTYSMGQAIGQTTAFAVAQTMSQDVVRGLPRDAVVSLVYLGGRAEVLREGETDHDSVHHAIGRVSVSDHAGRMADAIEAVETLTQQPTVLPYEVYLVSDLQRSTWSPTGGDNRDATALLARLGQRCETFVLDTGGENGFNAYLTRFEPREPVLAVGMEAHFEVDVEVRNMPGTGKLSLTLFADEDRVGEPPPSGGGAPGKLLTRELTVADLHDGRATVVFGHTFVEPGEHLLRVELEGDGLNTDNQQFYLASVPANVALLIIDPKYDPAPTAHPFVSNSGHLRHAAAPVTPPGFDRLSPFAATVRRPEEVLQLNLDQYAAVILTNVGNLSDSLVSRLEQYVGDGGNLVLFVGDAVAPYEYNTRLFKGGKGLLPGELEAAVGIRPDEAVKPPAPEAGRLPRLLGLSYSAAGAQPHPAIANVRQMTRQPAPPSISRYMPIKLRNRQGEPSRAVAWYTDQQAAVVERTFGRGKVMLVNTSADASWNYLVYTSEYIVLMQELLRYLVGAPDHAVNLRLGQPFEQPVLLSSQYLLLRRPDHAKVRVAPVAQGHLWRVSYEQTDRQGVYEVDATAEVMARRRFVVNLVAAEGDLSRLVTEPWRGELSRAGISYWGPDKPVLRAVQARHSVSEYAWVFLWALFGLLAVETLLAVRFGRRRI